MDIIQTVRENPVVTTGINDVKTYENESKKDEESVIKIVSKVILWTGIIISSILFLIGLFAGYDGILDPDPINWICFFSSISSMLFFILPTWGILTMLSNISTSLKKQNKTDVE